MEKGRVGYTGLLALPELRKRITFLLIAFIIYLVGVHIPIPGVDKQELGRIMQAGARGVLGLWNMFTGGALERFSIFALGLMPYINASIAMQLVQYAFPAYSKRIRDLGEAGRREISRYTRYGTLFFAFFESVALVQYFSRTAGGAGIFTGSGLPYFLMVYLSLTAGSCFLLWLGEEITNKGIGQGVSLLIFAGIVVNIPQQLAGLLSLTFRNPALLAKFIFYVLFLVGLVLFIVFVELSERKIPVQYARKVVGRTVMGGQFSYLPVRINIGGVIPLVFALTFLMFIRVAVDYVSRFGGFLENLSLLLNENYIWYYILLAVLILFSNHFYSAVVFKPDEIAENLRDYGGFIPGIRPGKPTEEYIGDIHEKITWLGGFYLVVVGVLTLIVPRILLGDVRLGIFSMTGILIAVGVALDLVRQIEAHIVTRQYAGFIR
ncbi:MAG: preprotein translocase subunit SecY [bacterium JZ-2024 1]